MAEHAVARTCHSMGANEKNSDAALCKTRDTTGRWIVKDVLRTSFQAVRKKAFETVGSAGAMTVDHLDLACSGCTGAPHSRIHLISIEFPALFVEGVACRNLFPGLDARNTFHVTKDNDTHTIPPFTWYPQKFFFPAYTYPPGRIPTLCSLFYNLASFVRVFVFLVLSFLMGGV